MGWSKNSIAESVDFFGTTDHVSGRKKKLMSKTSRFTGKLGLRIEDRGSRDQGSVKKNLQKNK